MKVLILSVTLITNRHKKAKSIDGDELKGFPIPHKISVNGDGLTITGRGNHQAYR